MYGLSVDLLEGAPSVLHVRGDLDVANADEFGSALKHALSTDSSLVVDLAESTFIDAAGLRVILHAADSRDGLGPLTVVHGARAARLLELVGLDDLRTIDFADEG